MLNKVLRLFKSIGESLGVDDLDFLSDMEHPDITFLIARYNGGGLGSHLDWPKFGSIVFALECADGKREDAKIVVNGKVISFGMEGYERLNKSAELEIDIGDAYCFWGWLRRCGVHGVPNMKGNVSVMFIVRKANMGTAKKLR